ncbi:uncharacterized protein LOC131165834 isoform X2 [Malania oleifera]|uniref:uncharacterized protein LOC131165834 isoform X2 n=1 Tax=Malania oleifera TaxID=397392 RepID=UPI0025AD9DD1|nr:uncharacterized protein LOC131165834 isoform X2 [Malania oleifera]
MATFAPVSPWIPEDDLLLKNAVEAGASLEALAKGAVRFSRRFTLQELQDRWYSLLYDPDISAEASAHMVGFDLSAANPFFKSNVSGKSREGAEISKKRKIESVRNQYYAMRKKIHRKIFNSTELGFLPAPNIHDCISDIDGCAECVPLDTHPPVGTCSLEDHISNHYGMQETGPDFLHHPLPQISGDLTVATSINVAANEMHSEQDNTSNGILRRDCLFEFPEDISSLPLKEPVGNDGGHSFDQKSAYKRVPNIIEDNLIEFRKCSIAEEIGHSQALPDRNLFKMDDSGEKPSSSLHSINENMGKSCCGYERSDQFSSPVSDGMPLWKTMEDVSAPVMPINARLRDKAADKEGTFTLSGEDDGKNIHLSGDKIIQPGTMLGDGRNGVGLNSSTAILDSDFGDLPESLLNFENGDDPLLIELNGKDKTNDSFLLCSPNNAHEGDIPDVSEHKAFAVLNSSFPIRGDACPTDSIADVSFPPSRDQLNCYSSVVNVSPSTFVPDSHSPELHDGVIHCTLNSEDPDIPCNDGIFLPAQVTASFASSMTQPTTSASNRKDVGHGEVLKKERENPAQSCRDSQKAGPSALPDIGPDHLHGSEVRYGLSTHSDLAMGSRYAKNNHRDPIKYSATQATQKSTTCGGLETIKESFEEMAAPAAIREHLLLHPESVSSKMAFPEPEVNPLMSDQEEYESDGDIPYFSDIEAMILDMDLGPYEQDPSISREVARFHEEDARRMVMRLEQCAHSSLQRAIASQGAFAVLYGRHVKHYIKKAEVTLGRATGEIDVDIDLGREGRANKISRRQAIIKLDRDGSFLLKNLGKSSIFVNGKEVGSGQLLILCSNCLIEGKHGEENKEAKLQEETVDDFFNDYIDSLTSGRNR